MLGWWANKLRFPEYVNRLEDAQNKSMREPPDFRHVARSNRYELAPRRGEFP